jgi:hypothetical protein
VVSGIRCKEKDERLYPRPSPEVIEEVVAVVDSVAAKCSKANMAFNRSNQARYETNSFISNPLFPSTFEQNELF